VTHRQKQILRAVLYPLFYLVVLALFFYWTFPFERVKDRLLVEFNSRQPAGPGVRMEIDDLDGYWFSGIEAEGVRLISPPPPVSADEASEGEDKPKKSPEPKVVTIEQVHVRVSLLRLLFGTMHVSFGADAFGGEVRGSTSDAGNSRRIEIKLENVDLNELPMLSEMVGLPMTGAMSGTIELLLPEQKLSQAEGKISLKASNVTIGDGKAKIRDTIALPKLDAGELEIEAEVNEGRADIQKLGAKGADLELVSDGKLRMRDPFDSSLLELGLRFKFSDAYKNKSDMTRGLFGAPGSNVPGLFDMDPKNQRAKRPDGFYAFRVSGQMSKLDTQPAPLGASGTLAPLRGPMRGFTPRVGSGEP
jgi:type II secretion system protein N